MFRGIRSSLVETWLLCKQRIMLGCVNRLSRQIVGWRVIDLKWSAFIALLLGASFGQAADGPTGAQIFKQKCAICHGAGGEGTNDNYPQALEGDKSIAQLAKLIARTMPKEAPKKCTAEEANLVADYIYDAFYSKIAQARNRPARIELSRLTVRQYRNAIVDLIGEFRPPARWGTERGLKAEYFKSRNLANGDRLIERIDPQVAFDFGLSSPDPAKFDEEQFSIRWNGSVLAPETGVYEFIVRTENGARLWVNDNTKPLIDAWVKSGKGTEFRGSIYLLGGRAYPLRLEFSKAKVGVDDTKTRKEKPPPVKSSIALFWKVPSQSEDVIPSRNLSPERGSEVLALETPFPPDDRSVGYERGTSVSKAWDRATTDAALEVTGYVVTHVRELAGVRDDAPDRAARLRAFCLRFAERALRRPLTAEQKRFFVERHFEGARDLDLAIKKVVLLVLKSPWFLYRELNPNPDAYDVASRISFGLWDSLPDKQLLAAAAAGKLTTREQVKQQAERMLADLRTRSKIREFLHLWLKIDATPDITKDSKRYPGFSQQIVSDLRTSLDLFLDDVVWSEESDFRQLFLTDSLFLNGRLAVFYDEDLAANASFQKIEPDRGERAGILSHPYLMACFAYTATTSPIHRGVFIARNLLGQGLRPPPQAFAPLPVESHPGLTTRERVALQTKPNNCQTCHSVINPLGFPLEHFDAVGRFRDVEEGKPIDSSGGYQTPVGEWVKFNGVKDLATYLVSRPETKDTFVERLFQYLVKQPVRAFGPQELADLGRSFAEYDFNIKKLIVEEIVSSAFASRKEKP
jgi:cytochrome c553